MSRIALFLSVFALSAAKVFAAANPLPAPVSAPGIPSSPANWAQTLERIASGVVTIQIDSTRAFDTEWNTTAQATGFVIDAKRGLILTNRHVVTPGPVTAQAIFLNREEVQLYPVYRDPIHDFGIYRYDPAKLQVHPAGRIAAVSRRRGHRPRNSRGRQRCRRTIVDPRRHAGAPGSRSAGIRLRQVQRLQYLLLSGRLRHVGRLVGLAGDRHRGPGGGAERRRRDRRRLELLSAADGGDSRA